MLAAGDDLDSVAEERLRLLVASLRRAHLSERDACRRAGEDILRAHGLTRCERVFLGLVDPAFCEE